MSNGPDAEANSVEQTANSPAPATEPSPSNAPPPGQANSSSGPLSIDRIRELRASQAQESKPVRPPKPTRQAEELAAAQAAAQPVAAAEAVATGGGPVRAAVRPLAEMPRGNAAKGTEANASHSIRIAIGTAVATTTTRFPNRHCPS